MFTIKMRGTTFFLAVAFLAFGNAQETCVERIHEAEVDDDYLEQVNITKQGGICDVQTPGASWAYGRYHPSETGRNHFEYFDSYGMANIEKNIKSCPYGVQYAWASITKSATGVIAANLAFEGLLDLDGRAFDYLFDEPNFVENLKYLKCAGESPVPEDCAKVNLTEHIIGSPEERTFTVRQLLSHKAGLPHFGNHWTKIDGNMVYKSYLNCEGQDKKNINTGHLWGFHSCSNYHAFLIAKPGEHYSYSNFGFDLAGVIMEKVSGLNYFELVQKYIAKPLGLSSVDLLAPWVKDGTVNEAIAYDETCDPAPNADQWYNMFHRAAGGAIRSTTADLFAYAKALHDFDTRLLPTKLSWIADGKTPNPTTEDAMTYFWEIRKDEDLVNDREYDNDDKKIFYSMGINKKLAPGRYDSITPLNKAAHHQYLWNAYHGGRLPQIRSKMRIFWSWGTNSTGPQQPWLVNVIHSSYRLGVSEEKMRVAINNAIAKTKRVRMPVFEIGHDPNTDPCNGCESGTRKYRMGLRMDLAGADGGRQWWPKDKNTFKNQNEPYIFETYWRTGSPEDKCDDSGHFQVDAFMDVDGTSGSMTTVQQLKNGELPLPGVTQEPVQEYWLIDQLNQFADNRIFAYDPDSSVDNNWDSFTAAGFHPLTIQGVRKSDGTGTCFNGVWVYNNHEPQNDLHYIQKDVNVHDVDHLTTNTSIPTSVSLYYDQTLDKLMATVVWKKSDAVAINEYMMPRSANGSAALTYEEYLDFFESQQKECEIVNDICHCWVPILTDSHEDGKGSDHYISVWQLKPSANSKVFQKLRMSENYFQMLTRPAACDGYRVTSYTRHFNATNGWLISAIWEKPKCNTPSEISTGDQCDPGKSKKPRLEPTIPGTGDLDEWYEVDPITVVEANFTEYNFNGEPLPFPYPLPFKPHNLTNICRGVEDPLISACGIGEKLNVNQCGHFYCYNLTLVDSINDYDVGNEDHDEAVPEEEQLGSVPVATERPHSSGSTQSGTALLNFKLYILSLAFFSRIVF